VPNLSEHIVSLIFMFTSSCEYYIGTLYHALRLSRMYSSQCDGKIISLKKKLLSPIFRLKTVPSKDKIWMQKVKETENIRTFTFSIYSSTSLIAFRR